MKSSPGKRKITVLHRTCVLRRNTVFRKRNQLGMKKPQTGAGRLRFFLSAKSMKAAPNYDAIDSRKLGCPNLYPRVS
jgi:hypothetical protein